ncbi:unnamed protein product [Musa banksii]
MGEVSCGIHNPNAGRRLSESTHTLLRGTSSILGARVLFFSTMDRSRRGRVVKSGLRSVLKLVNSVSGFAGMGMILYSRWMIRSWYNHIRDSSDSTPPWFATFGADALQ